MFVRIGKNVHPRWMYKRTKDLIARLACELDNANHFARCSATYEAVAGLRNLVAKLEAPAVAKVVEAEFEATKRLDKMLKELSRRMK